MATPGLRAVSYFYLRKTRVLPCTVNKLFPVWHEALAGAAGGASQVKTKSMELFRRLNKLFPVWREALAGAAGSASQVRRKVWNYSEE
jgi:hypothetical protein